jgi:hypothetical protein
LTEPTPELAATPGALRQLERLGHRRLVVDWVASQCCSGVIVGDLRLRWISGAAAVPRDFVPLAAPPPLDAYCPTELLVPLRAARPILVLRGWGPVRRLGLELAHPEVWLDFLASARGCAAAASLTRRSTRAWRHLG